MNEWLEKFCKDVFVDRTQATYAARIVKGGVDAFEAYHGSARDEQNLKKLNEQAIWFVYDNKVLDGAGSDEDKRVEVLEHLERIHKKSRGS